MRLVRHLQDLPFQDLAEGSVITIGAYDGLHLGHEKLLERVFQEASRRRLPAVLMSFEPTPKEFFSAERPPARLMRFREKFESLAASGIDYFYCPRFAAPMRDIPAADFIRRILIHPMAGVLSAYGMGTAPLQTYRQRTVDRSLTGDAGTALDSLVKELAATCSAELVQQGVTAGDIETSAARYSLPDVASVRRWLERLLD